MIRQYRGSWEFWRRHFRPAKQVLLAVSRTALKAGRSGSVIEGARLQDKGVTFDLQEPAEMVAAGALPDRHESLPDFSLSGNLPCLQSAFGDIPPEL
jgi:hypothetical protein